MTEPSFTVGDRAPALTGSVNADLTGASARVHIRRPDGSVIDQPATVGTTSPTSSSWSYAWQDGDLSMPGWHEVEVEAKYSSGVPQTFGSQWFPVRPQIA